MRTFNVKVNGQSYTVEVEEVGAPAAQPAFQPQVAAPQAPKAVEAPKPQVAGGTQVVAPMPGLVVNLKVADGAQVKKDQAILVLEAMKMENDIVAPCDGIISYQVAKGANVDTGALLAVIK